MLWGVDSKLTTQHDEAHLAVSIVVGRLWMRAGRAHPDGVLRAES